MRIDVQNLLREDWDGERLVLLNEDIEIEKIEDRIEEEMKKDASDEEYDPREDDEELFEERVLEETSNWRNDRIESIAMTGYAMEISDKPSSDELYKLYKQCPNLEPVEIVEDGDSIISGFFLFRCGYGFSVEEEFKTAKKILGSWLKY